MPESTYAPDSRYAWLRLGVALLSMTIGSSAMYVVSVVLPLVQAEFGVQRAQASLPYTLLLLGFGFGGILMGRLADRFGQRLRYIIVRNQMRGDDFGILERSGQLVRAKGLGAHVMDLRHLHDPIVQKIDARNASFWSAKNSTAIDGAGLSLMERQRLRIWLNHAYSGIHAAGA